MNLQESPFIFEKFGIRFYFSSEFYLKKFTEGQQKFIDEENMKLEVRFKNPINAQLYFLFVYYGKVEKRGFRVTKDEMEFSNPPVFQAIL